MVRVGIGGWTFAPWRGVFYPEGLPRTQELSYASRQLTALEVNGTFYRTQSPATFRNWAEAVPADFVFSLKAPRYATHRTDLSEAGPSVRRFLESGITELGGRLGPILWQFAATHRFDADGFARFADMLVPSIDGLPLRHAVEVSHRSYRDEAFIDVLRERNIALAYIDDDVGLEAADVTADFIYARLKRGRDEEPLGYTPEAMEAWRRRVEAWAKGGFPDDLATVQPGTVGPARVPRDCFVFFIHGGKVRAPAAAQAFMKQLL